MPQCDHRIDLGRAPGRNVAGEQRRDGECHGDDCECQRVGWFYAIEQAGKKARERQRDDDSNCNANEGQSESLSNDKPQNVCAFCSQRHADANLVSPPRDGEG